jgi:type I restriction enzyme S subunit
MLLTQRKFVEPKINNIQPRSVLEKGDLLTNIVGASIGRSAMFDLDEIANTNQAVALIRLKHGLEGRYFLHVLNSPALVDHMHGQEVDVARANVSLTDVRNFPIAVPPVAEQQEIVRRVEALFALADKLETRLGKAQAQVDKLAPALLARAFRGELVPTEAELANREGRTYESASALLERIRSDRPFVKEEQPGKHARRAGRAG